MSHAFDEHYWETHWHSAHPGGLPAHPALEREIAALSPGTALDAGSGEGAEAAWLAAHGWTVTAVDISAEAVARARRRDYPGAGTVTWTQADLTHWEPEKAYDLVTTFYAHASVAQLDLYRRLSHWVSPGGTLLLVGHGGHHHDPAHPRNAVVTAEAVRTTLDSAEWRIETAESRKRSLGGTILDDVIVRARRLP